MVTRDDSGTGTGPPALSAPDIASAPSVSRPTPATPGAPGAQGRRDPGDQTAAAHAATTSVSSPASSANSSPTVPCPAITTGSSNGWTSVSPRPATGAPAGRRCPCRRSAAPTPRRPRRARRSARARCARHDHGRLHIEGRGHHRERDPVVAAADRDHARRPFGLAQRQQLWRWPRGALNEPVRWSSSSLAVTGTPSSALQARAPAPSASVRRVRRSAARRFRCPRCRSRCFTLPARGENRAARTLARRGTGGQRRSAGRSPHAVHQEVQQPPSAPPRPPAARGAVVSSSRAAAVWTRASHRAAVRPPAASISAVASLGVLR